MISIFNGRSRALGEGDKQSVFVQFSVELRRHLAKFEDSQWIVFCAIALHADQDGWAWPSIGTLASETGLSKETVTRSITGLCSLEIEGKRVMLAYQPKQEQGKKFLSNRYLIFPSPADLGRYDGKRGKSDAGKPYRHEPYTVQPCTAEPNTVDADTKENHLKQEPLEIACVDTQAPSPVKKAKERKPKAPASAEDAKLSEHANTLMFARVCRVDMATATFEKKQQVFQSARISIEQGYSEQEIYDAGMYWYTSDWRSQYKTRPVMRDRVPPSPAQLRELLGERRLAKETMDDPAKVARDEQTRRTDEQIEQIKQKPLLTPEAAREWRKSFFAMTGD